MDEATNIPENATPTFADRVNEVVSKATTDDNGNLVLPEGVEADEAVLYAANLEKRRRDTQSAYTKSQTELKATKSENEKLAANLQTYTRNQMTDEQREELDQLKHDDPEAWRNKLNELEQANAQKFQEQRENIRKEASQETELKRRERLLEEFNEANPDLQITDDLLENDVPPRFVKQLSSGELTFEDFLDKVKSYLTKGKVIAPGDTPPAVTDPGKVGGGSTPDEAAINAQMSDSYREEIY